MLSKRARKQGLERMRRYVADLLPLAKLAHWQVILSDDPPDKDTASASVRWNACDWRATIYLSDWFLTAKQDIQRLHVTHELVHLHLRGMEQAHESLSDQFGGQAWTLIDSRWVHELELATDGLAMALAPFLPLPPKD